jgi:pimeloyl-ACP methyl ester carboxylesterase
MRALMAAIEDRSSQVQGIDAFWRRAEPDVTAPPVLYLHGAPSSSDDWLPFLARTGGIAPDLPGFGRSGKPASFDYSIPGYDRWLEEFLDHAGIDRFSLVVHDWGCVGLALAQRQPERVERLVVTAAVPLLPGYRWHRAARIWRTPFAGEMFQGLATKWAFKQLSKEANVAPGPLPQEEIDRIWEHYDHGTQRAILKLYRSADPEVLEKAGRDLGRIQCPALVLTPDTDPYIGAEFGQAYAAALGNAEHRTVERAGHWPWLDRPEMIDDISTFLAG